MKTFEEFNKDMTRLSDFYDEKILNTYQNGNFYVGILADGTRVKETIEENDCFKPEFAMNCDVKITDYCDAGCPYCHEGSSTNGKMGNLNLPIFDTWKAGTEMAIGGGNALAHPDLIDFLKRMKGKGVICNLTINQKHIKKYWDMINEIIDNNLAMGIGISLTDSSNADDMSLINTLYKKTKNIVIHTIAGILSKNDFPFLANKKVLILGYKNNVGRGVVYNNTHSKEIQNNIDALKKELPVLKHLFSVMSFDNLAIQQLDVKKILNLSDEYWDRVYQGDDYGELCDKYHPTTFYFDAVSQTIGRSSTQPYEDRIPYNMESYTECFKLSLKCLEERNAT